MMTTLLYVMLMGICPLWYPANLCRLFSGCRFLYFFMLFAQNLFCFIKFSLKILHFIDILGLPLVGLPIVSSMFEATLMYCPHVCGSLKEIHITVWLAWGCMLDHSQGLNWAGSRRIFAPAPPI